MKTTGRFLILSVFLIFIILIAPMESNADMNDYCITPPFVIGGVNPNLLLMLDNSASMYDLAYISSSGMFCYDNSFDKISGQYAGYFDPDKFYTSAGITYTLDTTTGNTTFPQFQETASLPASGCTFKSDYLCITTAGTTPDNVTQFVAKGNFLNWLTASKLDVQKLVLTGGKYDTASHLLIGESRGCVGQRFVKEIPDTDWTTRPVGTSISFGIRGDVSNDIRLPSTGGTTRIDIFKGNFDNDSCQQAVTNWASGGTGENSNSSATAACLNVTATNSTPRTIWNHALQTCWSCAHSPCIPDDIGTGDISRITGNNECGSLTVAQMAGIPNTDPKYICLRDSTSSLTPSFSGYSGPVGGYIGVCADSDGRFSNSSATDTCIKNQFASFCNGLQVGEVVDPSSGAQATGTLGNIPANLVDGGIVSQLGNPIRTYHVRVSQSTAPTGVIQEFQSQIRIGAMTFNNYGSKSECTGSNPMIRYTCSESSNKDAGRIIWPIGQGTCSVTTTTTCSTNSDCPSGEQCTPVGNHDGGLVKNIDSIMAATWTPYAEAFYNAVAYFTKDAVSTNSNLDATKYNPAGSAIQTPLNSDDVPSNKNPILYRCQKNNILLVTDGASTTDRNELMMTKVQDSTGYFRDPATTTETDTCGNYSGSPYLHDLSYFAYNRNIFDPSHAWTLTSNDNAQHINTYIVYNGATTSSLTGVCDPYTQMQKTATNGGTTLLTASNQTEYKNALREAFKKIAVGTASGTASSILSSSEGSGANLLQAVFYPQKTFDPGSDGKDTKAVWVGEMQNLWYYLDPFLQNSTIREDTDKNNTLNLLSDHIVSFYFDPSDNMTKVVRFADTDGDGVANGAALDTISPDLVNSLWRAGKKLHSRSASDRTIYTTLNGTTRFNFTDANSTDATLQDYLQATGADATAKAADAANIIDYVRGSDLSGPPTYRSRTVTVGTSFGNTTDVSGVWKLGDIVSSTPKIESMSPLNNYHLTPPTGYGDNPYYLFTGSNDYKSRGMVYVGANDGMLHAFRLGTLSVANQTKVQKATLTDPDGNANNLGKEEWAFIPKNALPYLKYLYDPSYSHLYYVDNSTKLVDASINYTANHTASDWIKFPGCDSSSHYWNCENRTVFVSNTQDLNKTETSWKTVLIGGMGLGGASSNMGDSCTNCVKTPVDSVGFSSYFALDVTNPANPTLMWEFTNAELGYTTTGPAVVRTGERGKNGRWFAVFGSGPTGPIDTVNHQFLGRSNQHLKIFIVDLASGSLVRTIDTGIANAFAGSLASSVIDTDRTNPSSGGFYSDDAIYIGYVTKDTSASGDNVWTKGGVIRLITNESTNPDDWAVSTVINNVGPVTSSITKLQDKKNNKLWLYFGTGRYFFKSASAPDDANSGQTLYGIQEPCYNSLDDINPTCTDSAAVSDLQNQTSTVSSILGAGKKGWLINLDTPSTGDLYQAERVITDPIAATNGAVFFTTFRPTPDICAFGGNSYIWSVRYDSGAAPPSAAMRGKALLQVSTGAFAEISLSSAFGAKNNRRTTNAITGVPPKSQGLSLMTNPKPIKKILHIQER